MLDDELLVTVVLAHIDPVLSLHDFSADSVLLVIFWAMCSSSRGFPTSSLCVKVFSMFLLNHFCLDLGHNCSFTSKCLATKAWEGVCWVCSSSYFLSFCYHRVGNLGTINSVGCVILCMWGADWFFEVEMSLWNMLFGEGSSNVCKFAKRSFFSPITNEGTFTLSSKFVVVSFCVTCHYWFRI